MGLVSGDQRSPKPIYSASRLRGKVEAKAEASPELLRPPKLPQAAGMPGVPGEFSVVPQHQVIPSALLAEISDFIHCFDRVTAREAWQAAALREAPAQASRG